MTTSAGFSELSGQSSSASISAGVQEKVVETDDPDIKIIETFKSPRKPQKRRFSDEKLLNPQGKPYKDHAKNLLFKVCF